jgi:hypothetical protein
MTISEMALGQMLEVYGQGDMPDVLLPPLLERCEKAGMRKVRGNQAAVQIDPTELRTLIDAARAAKALTKMQLPPGVVMTKQYFALLAILDRILLEPRPVPAPLSECTHDTLRPHRFSQPGLECVNCHRWVSSRQIFEAEVEPGGYIDDTSSPQQMVEKRAALVRKLLDDPEQARTE